MARAVVCLANNRHTPSCYSAVLLLDCHQLSVDDLQQLADAKLVHARLSVVGLGLEGLVQALGEADRNNPGRLLAIGGSTGALAKPSQEELNFGVLGGLF